MKVLMFGWEFPPYKSGGLGTACYDLTKGLARNGVDVTFVMPQAPDDAKGDFVKLIGANRFAKNIKIRGFKTILTPYMTSDGYDEAYAKFLVGGTKGDKDLYGKNMHEEVDRFSQVAKIIAQEEDFDVIHVHDWMTYEAGYFAKEVTGKPVVAHIHATEYDRTGGNPNTWIAGREEWGLKMADRVIANSYFTKENVMRVYGIDPDKIDVVHWGIDPDNPHYSIQEQSPFKRGEKIVLFLGRVTIQKGPDYFIEMAHKVLQHEKKVKFVFAGNGDMLPRMMDRAAELGISKHILFTGFLTGADVHRAFQMADLFVMPSVSEPFGLVALEALKNKTPVLISKQSGVQEVLNHALKVDFWDVDQMTNMIVSCLRHNSLLEELTENSFREVQDFNLDTPALKTRDIYEKVLSV